MNFIDLQKQYQAYKPEIDEAIRNVVESAGFIMGPAVKQLEQELAAYTTAKHALTCSSGTDALILGLLAYAIQPGDEIITSPFSFIAAAEAIAFLKAKPVFADIDPRTYNIDPEKIPAAITEKTRGIIAVDIFGQCADYDELSSIARQYDLFLIEDAAQSFGALYKGKKACSFGDISCTSFFPAKPLGCFGDGGALFTNNAELAQTISSLRVHGKGSHKYEHIHIGINGRLDAIQAAVLSVKLRHYDDEIQKRQAVAEIYNNGLDIPQVKTPVVEEHNLSVYAQYVIQAEHRDELASFLKKKDIPTAIHYPMPLHLQPALNSCGYAAGDFPIAKDLCERVLALPMHAFLEKGEQEAIITAVKEFYGT